MAYDQTFAARVRNLLPNDAGLVEKKMFGGLGWILNGNMACGVSSTSDLIVRVAPAEFDEALKQPGARIFDMSGKPMKGWLVVAGDACKEDATISEWVEQGMRFAASLPAK